MKPIRTIAVVGAGTMGQGIARSCATAGFFTLFFDAQNDIARKGLATIGASLQVDVRKGKMQEKERQEVLGNIVLCQDLLALKADLVIEVVVEDLAIKQELFAKLEESNSPDAILVTNTSSLSVTKIASRLKFPGRCAGMHFFNPAHLMKLVEVVSSDRTTNETTETLLFVCKALGKIPVLAKDSAGFIVNRVARHYYVESLKAVEDDAGNIVAIDRLLRSAGFKMGPFELMDLIGIDINYHVTTSLYHAYDEHPKFKPSAIQEEKVRTGQLGRKTGKGFYTYENK